METNPVPQLVVFSLKCTTAQYDAIWEQLRAKGFGSDNVLFHCGAQEGDQMTVVDVWPSADSEAMFEAEVASVIRGTGAEISWKMQPVRLLMSSKTFFSAVPAGV